MSDFSNMAEITAQANAEAEKSAQRQQVESAVDPQGLLIATNDVATLLFVSIGRLASALSGAAKIEDVRAAAVPLAEIASHLIKAVDAGQVHLPCDVKGERAVIEDLARHATGLADALTAASDMPKAE